jgi:hypothetical protein
MSKDEKIEFSQVNRDYSGSSIPYCADSIELRRSTAASCVTTLAHSESKTLDDVKFKLDVLCRHLRFTLGSNPCDCVSLYLLADIARDELTAFLHYQRN